MKILLVSSSITWGNWKEANGMKIYLKVDFVYIFVVIYFHLLCMNVLSQNINTKSRSEIFFTVSLLEFHFYSLSV